MAGDSHGHRHRHRHHQHIPRHLYFPLTILVLLFNFINPTSGNVCESSGGECTPVACCPYDYYSNASAICTAGTVCCKHPSDCDWQQNVQAASQWPAGTFALPQTIYGCPRTASTTWSTGYLRLTKDDLSNANVWSHEYHMRGPYSSSLFSLTFCSRLMDFLKPEVRDELPEWPTGNYCVLRMDEACPIGFEADNITIPTDGMVVEQMAPLPVFISGDIATIAICCRQDGNPNTAIYLPTPEPFALLKVGDRCQEVLYMRSDEQYFDLRTLNSSDVSGSHVRLTFCYYQAYETCYTKDDYGASYTGMVNITLDRPCILETIYYDDHIRRDYIHNSDNYCYNYYLDHTEPGCIAYDDEGVVDKFVCGVAQCDFDLADYMKISTDKPLRQKRESPEVRYGMDGDVGTCSLQPDTIESWYQINMGRLETVVAVRMYDSSGPFNCYIRLANMYVGLSEGDFLDNSALYCLRNITTNGANFVHLVRCVQPVRGQYVTLATHVYGDTDIAIEFDRYNVWEFTNCMNMCEFEVYVTKEDLACGVPMRSLPESYLSLVSVSSSAPGVSEKSTSLLHYQAWCAETADTQPYIMMDLYFSQRIYGLWTQGGNDLDGTMVTSFMLEYGSYTDSLFTYQRAPRTASVFSCGEESHHPVRHTFAHSIIARYVKLVPVSWLNQPCMRFKLIVCNERPLTSDVSASSASSTPSLIGDMSAVMVDASEVTCAATTYVTKPWLAVKLSTPTTVSRVELLLGPYYGCLPSVDTDETWGYIGQLNVTLSGNTCQRWDEKTPHSHSMKDEDFPEGSKTLAGNYCRNPGYGWTAWCYTMDPSTRFEYCEVPACSNSRMVDIYVGTDLTTSDISEGSDNMLCGSSMLGLPSTWIMSVCESSRYGNTILITLDADEPDVISSCDIIIEQIISSEAEDAETSDQVHELACVEENAYLYIWFSHDPGEGALPVSLEVQDMLPDHCPLYSRNCTIPTLAESGRDIIYARYFCAYWDPQGVLGECTEHIENPGPVITTSFYNSVYDTLSQCTWTLQSPAGAYAKFEVTSMQLAPKETYWTEDTYKVDPGECYDHIMVHFETTEGTLLYQSEVAGVYVAVSPSNRLSVHLSTCQRFDADWPTLEIESSFESSERVGCAVQRDCDGVVFECGDRGGILLSLGYPAIYPPNLACTWLITVDPTAYIKLTFVDFDIFENTLGYCERDYIGIYDVDQEGAFTSLGHFCNVNHPPDVVYSSWNQLKLKFTSDSDYGSRGFQAEYDQVYSDNLPSSLDYTDCAEGWFKYESSCYRVFTSEASLTWAKAESTCQENGGHLVSIMSELEMQFIQYILSQIATDETIVAYMGLNDENGDGIWRWSDGSPLIYSNWHEADGVSQPDGGSAQRCSSLRLDQLRFHKNWHDIPCAISDVHRFICKTPSTISADIGELVMGNSSHVNVSELLFECAAGEYILQVYQCDGRHDCTDRSDESDICTQSPTPGACPEFSYQCASGSCISLAFVCDFKPDCQNGDDEIGCKYRNCTTEQWRCTNGECVPASAHCDLIKDCLDGSDETLDCYGCPEESTVGFQCYDGSCLRAEYVCDHTVDCAGLQYEDEDGEACVSVLQLTSCRDWRLRGYQTDGMYQISPDGAETVDVECDMTSYGDEVVTIVHSDAEYTITVSGYEAPGSYSRSIQYTLSHDNIAILKNTSTRCEQYFEFECTHAGGFMDSWYVSFSGMMKPYRREADEIIETCECRLDKACKEGQTECWCIQNKQGVYVDSGYFRDDDVRHDDVPVMTLTLADTGQDIEYIIYTTGPLRCYQSFDPAEVVYLCKNGDSYLASERCIYENDTLGVMKGCRDATHLENCEMHQCPVGYAKCPSGYCIGAWRVCDGNWDCAAGEDEYRCDEYLECDGMMRCGGGKEFCLDLIHRCDGVPQCPGGQDEWFCDLTCPVEVCSCTALSYWCPHANLATIPPDVDSDARLLDLSHNNITQIILSSYTMLSFLNLSHNHLEDIGTDMFRGLSNLLDLDLSFNDIRILKAGCFANLTSLRLLELAGNPLTEIYADALMGLASLQSLALTGFPDFTTLRAYTFRGLLNLAQLDISNNDIRTLEDNAFFSLSNVTSLSMMRNDISSFVRADFEELAKLEYLWSDDYMFCCFVSIPDENCYPEKDAISSCSDLMSNVVLRVFLWILGFSALIANVVVVVWRVVGTDKIRVPTLLVTNLAVADSLMGVYMIGLAAVDIYYQDRYIENSSTWRNSALCKFMGVLATISSEVSVMTLCVITGDRLVNICAPFSKKKLRMRSAGALLAFVWLAVALLAIIPLLPSDYFQGQFYSRTSVCVSIHLTNEIVPGWEYSVAIFHGLNFLTFIFVSIAYAYIFFYIKYSGDASASSLNKKREMAAARKMTLIVITDFCCWIPINIMGMLALSGIQIPGEVYAWTVVFILPVNSAVNPILYTISSVRVNRAQEAENKLTKSYSTIHSTISISKPEPSEQEDEQLERWIRRQGQIKVEYVVRVVREITALVKAAHDDDLTLGKWTIADVVLITSKAGERLFIECTPILRTLDPEGQFTDIVMLGKVTKRLLQLLTASRVNTTASH